jgi:hypothetical protein
VFVFVLGKGRAASGSRGLPVPRAADR